MTTDYLTTAQVAAALGLTTGRVRQLARALDLGTRYGERRLFSPADVAAMRGRKSRFGPDPAQTT